MKAYHTGIDKSGVPAEYSTLSAEKLERLIQNPPAPLIEEGTDGFVDVASSSFGGGLLASKVHAENGSILFWGRNTACRTGASSQDSDGFYLNKEMQNVEKDTGSHAVKITCGSFSSAAITGRD